MHVPSVNATSSQPQSGDVVLGCFRLTKVLGAGSFATAYLADQLGTDRLAVVKIPHAHMLSGPNGAELRRRFEAEARASTRIVHQNLVTVFVSGDTQYGVPAIAMEYVAGDTLGALLARSAPLPSELLGPLGEQLADVLATLHEAGVVHRDLSPSNILVEMRTQGQLWAKVLDLGVAKLLDAPSRTLGPMGTPGYVAPEQLVGEVRSETDVYSLGALLWWAITGSERPDDIHDGSLRRKIGMRIGPDPRSLRPDAPAGYAELVSRALIPEPSARPSAREFLDAWRGLGLTRGPGLGSWGSARSSTPITAAMRAPTLVSALPRVAVSVSNPVVRTQVLADLQGRADVEQASPRELGRAMPDHYAAAVLGEQLPDVGTAEFIDHLRRSYPDMPVFVVGPDSARRSEWLIAGAEGFIEIPGELPELAARIEQSRETAEALTTDPSTLETAKLRPSLIEAMRARAPEQLARSLEAFIGCVPQWIAELERSLEEAEDGRSRRTCQQLIAGAEAVGAESLARLAEGACQSLDDNDPATAQTLLAAAEQEYREVFREAFTLINQLRAA